jgi:hypothetical protein
VGNICGYHALVNLLEAIRLIKSKSIKTKMKLTNKAYFWRSHIEIGRHLKAFAQLNDMDPNAYYWKDETIRKGDFERVYLQVLNQ